MPEGLVVEGLVKEYSGDGYVVRVLDGRAFHAQADELVALVGPSGSGKSTLLSYLDDMLSPTSGSIYLDVTGTSGTSGSSCRASISFHHSMHARTSPFATKTMSRPEAFSKADEILDRVELGDKTNHKPSLRCSVNCTLGDELWRCQRATHG